MSRQRTVSMLRVLRVPPSHHCSTPGLTRSVDHSGPHRRRPVAWESLE